jgi:hypothetical protein
MPDYMIITPNFNCGLTNFTRSIENTAGVPIIKYTASPTGSQVGWITQDNNTQAHGHFIGEYIPCPPGSEILVVGDTIHFPANVTLLSLRHSVEKPWNL